MERPLAPVVEHAVEQIVTAAGELWPGERVRLIAHVPSVTSYVHRIQVGQRLLYAKYSLLGASLVSVVRGAYGDWNTVLAEQQRYLARPDGVLERELHDCGAIVICVRGGFATPYGKDVRMGGLNENSRIVRHLALGLRGYLGVVLMVTNPVDVMARLCAAISGCRVYGVGAGLDTARYRGLLGAAYGVPASKVSGDVIGEHGDAAVCCLSTRYGNLGAWLGQPIMFTAGRGRVRLPELTDVERKSVDDASHKLVEAYASLRIELYTKDEERT